VSKGTRIFYDTEFIEDGRTIDLISIGMVREDTGAELYAVNFDMPIGKIRKHKWLMENVVPGLPKAYGDARNMMPKSWLFNYADPCVKRIPQIADEVLTFILDTTDPQLWGWYSAYDHVALAQLWGAMVDLPEGIPMWTNDLRQESARLGSPDLPVQESGLHNALADARHNMVIAHSLDEAATDDWPPQVGDVWFDSLRGEVWGVELGLTGQPVLRQPGSAERVEIDSVYNLSRMCLHSREGKVSR
jgi:hypothetical protein